jgi:hypothetical protein
LRRLDKVENTLIARDIVSFTSPELGRDLSVLVISPDPRVMGGFIGAMLGNLTFSKAQTMWVGSMDSGSAEARRESSLGMAIRSFTIPFKVMSNVLHKNFDVVHINHSFDLKSLVRDGLILFFVRLVRYRKVLFYIHGW